MNSTVRQPSYENLAPCNLTPYVPLNQLGEHVTRSHLVSLPQLSARYPKRKWNQCKPMWKNIAQCTDGLCYRELPRIIMAQYSTSYTRNTAWPAYPATFARERILWKPQTISCTSLNLLSKQNQTETSSFHDAKWNRTRPDQAKPQPSERRAPGAEFKWLSWRIICGNVNALSRIMLQTSIWAIIWENGWTHVGTSWQSQCVQES